MDKRMQIVKCRNLPDHIGVFFSDGEIAGIADFDRDEKWGAIKSADTMVVSVEHWRALKEKREAEKESRIITLS